MYAFCLWLLGPLEDMNYMSTLDTEIFAKPGVWSPWLHYAAIPYPQGTDKGRPGNGPKPPLQIGLSQLPFQASASTPLQEKESAMARLTLKSRLVFKGKGNSRMYHGGGARRDDEAEGCRKRGFRWDSLYQSPFQRESIP